MKEFRVAKCMDKNGIHEYAIFKDGSRKKRIQNDKQYGKYFEVDNELNNDTKSVLKYHFTGRIKDAIDMIRSGNGDCIQCTHLLGQVDNVIYFLDRKVGEELRQKTLEGWKDAKFGWTIECGHKKSLSGYCMLSSNTSRKMFFDDGNKPISFETKEEAITYIEGLIERARYYAKRLANKLANVDNDIEQQNVIETIWKEIEEYTQTKHSVVQEFMYDMLTEDFTLKSFECNLDEMGYKVIQCIV